MFGVEAVEENEAHILCSARFLLTACCLRDNESKRNESARPLTLCLPAPIYNTVLSTTHLACI